MGGARDFSIRATWGTHVPITDVADFTPQVFRIREGYFTLQVFHISKGYFLPRKGDLSHSIGERNGGLYIKLSHVQRWFCANVWKILNSAENCTIDWGKYSFLEKITIDIVFPLVFYWYIWYNLKHYILAM